MARIPPCVLYVDDDAANRLVFEETFAERFRVLGASSGREALEILRTEEVAVVLTDQRMPEMSGNELLKRVKEEYPNVVRAVITAYSDLEPILQAVNQGLVARYVVKPWARTEIEQVLTWGLDAYQLGKQSSEVQLRLLATERLVTLGVLSQTIYHDMNQPLMIALANFTHLSGLSPVCPALEKLLQKHGDEVSDHERQVMRSLVLDLRSVTSDGIAAINVLKNLVARLRSLGSPRPQLANASCEPWPCIRFAMTACKQLALGLDPGLTYAGSQELPRVAIGETELMQVLMNLVANGIQAVRRKVPCGKSVRIESVDLGDALQISVTDDGSGMPPELLEKVGREFFSTRAEGTGLGLFQCRRLVEGAGGTFSIESQMGVGTTAKCVLKKAEQSTT